jgi:putative flippase GtrA
MNLRKLFIFGVVGTIATPAHYITLILLVEVGGFGPVIATSAGSAAGALANYLLNHRYTFKSAKRHFDAGPKFMSVALGTGVLNALLVFLGVDLLGMYYLLVQFVATLVVFLTNFLLNSFWTFHEEKARE